MLADTNTGQASDLRKAYESNEEIPITVKNDKGRNAEEQLVIQANEPPEMVEDETLLARRRPRRDIKPVIRLGIDKQMFYFDTIDRFYVFSGYPSLQK